MFKDKQGPTKEQFSYPDKKLEAYVNNILNLSEHFILQARSRSAYIKLNELVTLKVLNVNGFGIYIIYCVDDKWLKRDNTGPFTLEDILPLLSSEISEIILFNLDVFFSKEITAELAP